MVDDDEAPAGMGLHEAGSLGPAAASAPTAGMPIAAAVTPERLEQPRPVEARFFGPCHDGDRCRSQTVATISAAANAKKIPASIAWNVQN